MRTGDGQNDLSASQSHGFQGEPTCRTAGEFLARKKNKKSDAAIRRPGTRQEVVTTVARYLRFSHGEIVAKTL
jgi:hypothetical protein